MLDRVLLFSLKKSEFLTSMVPFRSIQSGFIDPTSVSYLGILLCDVNVHNNSSDQKMICTNSQSRYRQENDFHRFGYNPVGLVVNWVHPAPTSRKVAEIEENRFFSN